MGSSLTSGSPQDSLLDAAEFVICRVVRRKLHVTLRTDDGRERNADALDLLGDIRLKLVRKLAPLTPDQAPQPITDWEGFAATVAYNTCNDYLRAKYPQRTRLRNALHRLFDKADGYAVWGDAHGELICGFVGQRSTAVNSKAVPDLLNHPDSWAAHLPKQTLIAQPLNDLSPKSLLALADAILTYANAPVSLDQMLVAVQRIWGLQDGMDVSLSSNDSEDESAPVERLASKEPSPDSSWLTRERLKLLWGAILQLLPWHRIAYLLNLRDGELEAFPYYGVASLEEIGSAIGLTDDQFRILADELRLDENQRSQATILQGSGQKFMLYVKFIPLEDTIIANTLGVTRAQVIAYRNKGIERLRRNLRGNV
ncbi:MAG: hypothetical protein ABI824_11605 [Acidobacteriota bacterium]